MIATGASPGQGTLEMAEDSAPGGFLAMVIVKNRKTSEALRCSILGVWTPKIIEWNKSLDAAGRYDAAMNAEDSFQGGPMRRSN